MSDPYYSDDMVTVFHGDCRDVLPTLEQVDHIIADPPYSRHVHTSARRRNLEARDRGAKYGADVRRNIDLGFEHLSDELRDFCGTEFSRIAKRWVLVFSDTESGHLWRQALTSGGGSLDYVRTGAWIKIGSTPQFSGDRPATGFEAITICHPKGRKRWNGGGKHAIWQVPIVLDRGRTGTERLHTTQKPLPLMNALIDQFTDPNETILDPFAGSGTTALAAVNAGRRAIVIERDEAYAEVITRRLSERQPTLEYGINA